MVTCATRGGQQAVGRERGRTRRSVARLRWAKVGAVLEPLMTTPILIFSIVLVVTSVALALFVLFHKGRGGGLSDLFGGGISSSLGGSSVAERNLDRLTIIIAVIWLACIVALGLLYKLGS